MEDLFTSVLQTPADILLVVAGIAFLGIAVVGEISGKIEPGPRGRLASGVLGGVLLVTGLGIHLFYHDHDGSSPDDSGETVVQEDAGDPSAEEVQRAPGEDDTSGDRGSGEEEGFRVIETLLRADPFEHRGPCPVTIEFSGRISAIGGSGTVTYRFLRNDGASAPVRTLEFQEPGSKDVETTWRLGGEGFSYEGWQAIRILEPEEMESDRAGFTVECD